MLRVCTELPGDLEVISSTCWIKDFRAWLFSRKQKFPVERFLDFQQTLKEFLISQPSAASAMWLNDDGNLTATMFTFKVKPQDGPTSTLAVRDKWNEFIERLNSEATSTASGAWATAQVWVDMEALREEIYMECLRYCDPDLKVPEDYVMNSGFDIESFPLLDPGESQYSSEEEDD